MVKAVLKIFLAMCLVGTASADMTSYLKRTGQKYLDGVVAKNSDARMLKSGMVVEVLHSSSKADAKSPNANDPCEVTYAGTLKDGTPFDSGTTSFSPSQVIKGWTEAMQLMTEGDKWRLHIPYQLAYGERGSAPKIPPYSPLVFDIEIHAVKSGGKSGAEARKAFEAAVAPAAEL
jgi:FKBP-type peptidyl-prolyl cis-trans isomerase FklB